jgi:hypothetical protein
MHICLLIRCVDCWAIRVCHHRAIVIDHISDATHFTNIAATAAMPPKKSGAKAAGDNEAGRAAFAAKKAASQSKWSSKREARARGDGDHGIVNNRHIWQPTHEQNIAPLDDGITLSLMALPSLEQLYASSSLTVHHWYITPVGVSLIISVSVIICIERCIICYSLS